MFDSNVISLPEVVVMAIESQDEIKLKESTKVKVDSLRLDRENPRLTGRSSQAMDEEIIAQLYRSADLGELLQSIAANGYLDIEPLVVMYDIEHQGFTVLEGNRRLAAIRLLREPELSEKIKSIDGISISIPEMVSSLRDTLNLVSVYRVDNREDARSFIGFKHINGPAKWNPYAKARFAANWYKTEKENGVTLEQIAGAIGDQHATIKRMVWAIYVLDQAIEVKKFDIEDRNSIKFNFSHLYTALARSQYMEFLDFKTTWSQLDPFPNPVSDEKLEELGQILVWIYGSKTNDVLPVVKSQNPDIKRLGEVISNAEARHVLETLGNLEKAYESTQKADLRFTNALVQAREALRDAAGSLRVYDGHDQSLLDIAEDNKETAETVYQRMSKKHRDAINTQ